MWGNVNIKKKKEKKTVHSATKLMCFYPNFGYHPIDNYAAEVVESNVPAAEEHVDNLPKLRKKMTETLMLARERVAKYYNRNVFSEGTNLQGRI